MVILCKVLKLGTFFWWGPPICHIQIETLYSSNIIIVDQSYYVRLQCLGDHPTNFVGIMIYICTGTTGLKELQGCICGNSRVSVKSCFMEYQVLISRGVSTNIVGLKPHVIFTMLAGLRNSKQVATGDRRSLVVKEVIC